MTAARRAGLWGNLFIAAGALVVLGAATAWFLIPVRYEASALLKVASKPPAVLAHGPVDPEEFAVFKRTQVQLIVSYAVLNGTLREPAIHRLSIVEQHKDDPVTWLKEQLIVDYPDDAEIMRVTMRGTDSDDLVKIIDKVVDVYMQEIVQREKALRLDNEEKLRRAYESRAAEYQKELDALRTLELIHKTSGSEEAQLKKTLAMEELESLLARRRELTSRIDQLDEDIVVDKARAEIPAESRTADPPAAAAGGGLPLSVLEAQRRHLSEKVDDLNSEIERKTEELAKLNSFSAQVAAKQEDINALKAIRTQLGAELDRATVERLAPDRIMPVDPAALTEANGNATRKNVTLALAAACGMALLVLGLVLDQRGRRES